MVKVELCDICFKKGALVQSKYRNVIPRIGTIHLCENCQKDYGRKSTLEIIKFYFKLNLNLDLTDERAKQICEEHHLKL